MALSQAEKNYLANLNNFVDEKGLQAFYPEDCPVLVAIARQADVHVKSVSPALISSPEIAKCLARLSLYDIVLLLDDSPSMRNEEGGQRMQAMRTFLKRISTIAHFFDPEGISIRFLNHKRQYDSVTQEEVIDNILSDVPFHGCTQIGTKLREKIVDPLVIEPARAEQLKKPMLITMITDGKPTYEEPDTLKNTIIYTLNAMTSTCYTDAAVAFQIAQVGTDRTARAFIRQLDRDPTVGHAFANVAEEGIERMEATEANEDFDPDLWLVKLMVGAIDKADFDF